MAAIRKLVEKRLIGRKSKEYKHLTEKSDTAGTQPTNKG